MNKQMGQACSFTIMTQDTGTVVLMRLLWPNCFKHVNRIVEACAKHKIYTILDLHALPGGQNPDWHSDNVTNYAAFWDHKDFQDRVIWLWSISFLTNNLLTSSPNLCPLLSFQFCTPIFALYAKDAQLAGGC